MKTITVVVLMSLLVLPGCFIFDLAFNVLGTAFSLVEGLLGALFFWAAPGPPEAATPLAFEEPLPLSEALELARALGVEGTPILVPPESAANFHPGLPPRPGAVLHAIPVTGDR
jgi:hypothetical protein